MAIELLIFDLDGTLADTKLDLAHAVNATRLHFGLPPLDNELIYSYVGNGAPVLIRKAMGSGYGEAEIQPPLDYFLSHYREHMLDNATLYPGVRESLDRLRAAGVRLAVLTNKPEKLGQDMLAGLGVSGYFFRICGGNSNVQKKPDPAGVRILLEETGIPKERALMVGDSAVDVLTARNAGIAVCGVTYGFQPESLAGEPPDILVDRIEDLADMVVAERNLKGATQS